jgi:transaldolase
MTMPPKAAGEFLALGIEPDKVIDKTYAHYKIGLNKNVDPESIRLNTLWDIDENVVKCADAIEKENLDSFTPDVLVDFFKKHNCGDFIVRWSDSQIATSTKEGKIPRLENWRQPLADKSIGLDSLMNLAGLCSFMTDQKAMDERVTGLLAKAGK